MCIRDRKEGRKIEGREEEKEGGRESNENEGWDLYLRHHQCAGMVKKWIRQPRGGQSSGVWERPKSKSQALNGREWESQVREKGGAIQLAVGLRLYKGIGYALLPPHNLTKAWIIPSVFFLSFLYLFMRDTETGRGRSSLSVWSLMWDSIPGPWDHDLSQRQALNHWDTQVSLYKYIFISDFRVSPVNKNHWRPFSVLLPFLSNQSLSVLYDQLDIFSGSCHYWMQPMTDYATW